MVFWIEVGNQDNHIRFLDILSNLIVQRKKAWVRIINELFVVVYSKHFSWRMSDLEVNNTTTSALAQSVKKAAKKKKSKKLTPKQKALDKL